MNSIMYNLVPATMPNLKDSGKYLAQVQIRGSLGFEEMADRMIAQGSSITRSDILAVFQNLELALKTAMLEGYRVNFGGIFDMFPSITGTFDGITAAFTPAANGVDVRARCGSTVRDYVIASASVERVYLSKPAPTPMSYADLGSGTTDTTVTPGHIGTLSGQRLKFDASATDEGVFLVPLAGGAEVKVTAVQSNLPRELVFLVPTLTANAGYCLEVRARLNGADELRTGRLGKTLAVPSDPT